MALSTEDTRVESEALEFARKNKKSIAKRLTDPVIFVTEENPVSVFMAGSPGAGKTEASLELLQKLGDGAVIRIDPDELRSEFASYDGGNAWLFQKAVSVLVDRIHDVALDQKQSFLLDGTLSNFDRAEKNISRSLKKGRAVQILYVYQEPMLAWEFVQKREAAEGRRIRPEHFIEQYFGARQVVNRLKTEFGKQISIDLLLKNNDNSQRLYKAGIDQIDHHVPEKYGIPEVEQMLKSR